MLSVPTYVWSGHIPSATPAVSKFLARSDAGGTVVVGESAEPVQVGYCAEQDAAWRKHGAKW